MNSSPSQDVIPALQVGDRAIAAADLVPRLRAYGMLPAFLKELVIDGAIAPIALSAEDMAAAADRLLQANHIATPEQCQAFLSQRGLAEADLPALAERHQKIEQYKLATWGNQVESHFLERKASLDRVLYSLIRTQEAGLAQELYFRIQDDGQPFADLARQYSEGQEAQTGGLIGPVELSVPHPALGRILATSQPGKLWPPTRLGEWFVIVRLEKFFPARFDEPTRQRLLDELFNTWLVEQVKVTLQANLAVVDEMS